MGQRETPPRWIYTSFACCSLHLHMANAGGSRGDLGMRESLRWGALSFQDVFIAEYRRLHQALFAIRGSRTEAEDIAQDDRIH